MSQSSIASLTPPAARPGRVRRMACDQIMSNFVPQNADYADYIGRVAELSIFREWLELRIDAVSPGEVVCHIDARPDICHQPGYFQGTVISAIAQLSCSFACASLTAVGTSTATLEQSIRFLVPARGMQLIGRGKVIRPGRRISVASAEVVIVGEEGEQLCAIMSATCNHQVRAS